MTSRRGKLTSIATAAFGTLALSAVVAVGAKTAVLTRVYVAEGKSILTMISWNRKKRKSVRDDTNKYK